MVEEIAAVRKERPKTILVIEHDAWNRQEVTAFLEREGYAVLEASNGAAGLRMAEREHPSAIILGWQLPEMSGAQVVAALRAQRSLNSTPILVINADGSEPEDVQSLTLSQATPICRTELRARMHEALAPAHVESLGLPLRRRASGGRAYRHPNSAPSSSPTQQP